MTNNPHADFPPDERAFFDSTVHGLRSKGWSRIDAEGEALDRIETRRAKRKEGQ